MEPLSVLGVVGTSVGLLGFIITTISGTIENVHTRKELHKTCLKKLRSYESELKHQKTLLESWEQTWFLRANQPHDRATYHYLWGSDGYAEVEQKLRDISDEFLAVINILRFRHAGCAHVDWKGLPFRRKPSDGDIIAWNGLLNRRFWTSLDSDLHAGILWRFSFAIYKNKDISDRVEQLKSFVKQLKERSEDLFWNNLDQLDIRRPIDGEYLRKLIRLHRNRGSFIDFFRRLHYAHESDLYGWELVISEAQQTLRRALDLECRFHVSRLQNTITCLEEGADIYCTFYAETNNAPSNVYAYTFDICHPRDFIEDSESGRASLQTSMLIWNTPLGSNPYVFQRPLGQWQNIRKSLRQSIQHQSSITEYDDWIQIREYYRLIQAASGLSRAVVFFYGTGWVGTVCACDVVRVDLRYPSPSAPGGCISRRLLTFWPFVPNDLWVNCPHLPNLGVRYGTFLFLGVLLIEIAIVARVKIRLATSSEPNPGSIVFEVPARVLPAGLPTTLNQDQLIEGFQRMIPRGTSGHVGNKYYLAVKQCFKMREKFLERGRPELLITDLERCIEIIVKPLEDHCEALRQHYLELNQAIWGRSFFADI